MKVSPLAQGTGATAQNTGPSIDPAKMARAKAIASGETPQEAPLTGDPQVDRINTRRIKMKTQASTYREPQPVEESLEQPVVEDKNPVNEPLDEVAEETKPLSPQFAALMKTKRALQVKERELAAREEALKTQAPAGQEDILAKLKANPLSVLEAAGVSYDQLTEAIMNNQSAPLDPIKLRNEIREDLKKELLGEFSSRDQLQEQQVLADIKKDIVQTVNENPEQYEAIHQAKAYDSVKDLIHRTWKDTGEILDTQEAIDLVENQLIEEALPFAKIKKVQSRLTPAQEAVVAAQIPQPKPNTKVMRTLTNRDSALPTMDRKARALAAWAGTLKKG